MHDVASVYFKGLLMGASLIIAIGAQNAFVLTRSVRHDRPWLVAGLCALIDVMLIGVGVLGIGTLVARNQTLNAVAAFGGAAFLLWFGARSLLEAWRAEGGMNALEDMGESSGVAATVIATLAISLLNPHVYLDTVVMLGSISGNFRGTGRFWFGGGAATASVLWFFSLAGAGRLLAPVFRKPLSWRILHVLVTAMVWWIAFSLVHDFFVTNPTAAYGEADF